MELSPFTMQVLKNFSSINSNIVIKPGNTIMSVSEAKNILSSAQVEESFSQLIGIYDLNEFLNVIGLVDTPQLKFNDKHVQIEDASGRSRIRYFLSDTEMLTTPAKAISMPSVDVSFILDQATLNKLKRAASALGYEELSITGSNGVITLAVVDNENSTGNTYSIDVAGEFESEDFNFILNISNLKLIQDDYKVEISSKLISQFTSTNNNVTYWVALEKSSTYND